MSDQELAKQYSPRDVETKISSQWNESNVSAAASEPQNETYAVVIPPPNVTAALHLGHALNNTLQDVMVRYHRALGLDALWMPGTDHAGISTQTVVEKRLLKQGIKRTDMERDEFIAKVQDWKDEYEAIILEQLQAMGASCDWDRVRFTMDEMCSTAVRYAFFKLFDDGLIYRGKRLVNWDPVTQTALADDEVEMEDVVGAMYYLDYPLSDGTGVVTVATTRPETMMGDTAVAMNPNDPRADELRGKSVILPLVDREVPIIEDDYVVLADPESSDVKAKHATGFLKVTPAHDQNDWDIGVRHELPVINVLAADGTITDQFGWDDVTEEARQFIGMSREDAREAVAESFNSKGLLRNKVEYTHSVGHSYRSHAPIEPWLSDQWYVKVTDDRLRGSALRALNGDQTNNLADEFSAGSEPGDGELRFIPERYAKTFQTWHENINDWCISRQLWWGHQIPVWQKVHDGAEHDAALGESTGEAVKIDSQYSNLGASHTIRRLSDGSIVEAVCVPPQSTLTHEGFVTSEDSLIAQLEAAGYERDPDVLDTWFSSGLWPLSTMGWPYPQDYPETGELLAKYNPTSVLMTAREIITLWVSRMTMFNRYFLDGQVPFNDVYIHAMIQDGHGQKMSKSLGNGVDPRDIIYSHGSDAMRYALVSMTTQTQDVRMPVDLICPHCDKAFDPEYIETSAGYTVAAETQTCGHCGGKMVTLYGVASGSVEPTDEVPLARNSSPKFDAGRSFVNKLWNATRFALSRLDGSESGIEVGVESLNFADRWILSRLETTLQELKKAYDGYQYARIAELTYDFIWRDLCDVYLEAVKPTIDDSSEQKVVLASVFDAVARMLHPICPFVTEELWHAIQGMQSGSVRELKLAAAAQAAVALWPTIKTGLNPSPIESEFDRAMEVVSAVRQIRADRGVKPSKKIQLVVGEKAMELVAGVDGLVQTLAGVDNVAVLGEKPQAASSFVFEGEEIFVSGLVDAIDLDAERDRLSKVVADLDSQIDNLQKRLSNENYVNKAKPELVQQTREQLEQALADKVTAETALVEVGV